VRAILPNEPIRGSPCAFSRPNHAALILVNSVDLVGQRVAGFGMSHPRSSSQRRAWESESESE